MPTKKHVKIKKSTLNLLISLFAISLFLNGFVFDFILIVRWLGSFVFFYSLILLWNDIQHNKDIKHKFTWFLFALTFIGLIYYLNKREGYVP